MHLIHSVISFLKDEEYRDLLLTTTIVLGFGTVMYHYIEGWGWIDSLYFSVITLTTIGYGDLSPSTDLGKIFTIVYIIIGLGIILSFIETVQSHFKSVKSKSKSKKMKNLNQQ